QRSQPWSPFRAKGCPPPLSQLHNENEGAKECMTSPSKSLSLVRGSGPSLASAPLLGPEQPLYWEPVYRRVGLVVWGGRRGMGAGISAGGSAAGGKKGASGARDAANIQAAAAMAALAEQRQVRQENLDILTPFVDYGREGIPNLVSALDRYTQPIDTTLPTFD